MDQKEQSARPMRREQNREQNQEQAREHDAAREQEAQEAQKLHYEQEARRQFAREQAAREQVARIQALRAQSEATRQPDAPDAPEDVPAAAPERLTRMERQADAQERPTRMERQPIPQDAPPVRPQQGEVGERITQAKRVIDQIEEHINVATRIPIRRNYAMVDTAVLLDLLGQLRIVLPRTVLEAQKLLDERERILGEAKDEANRATERADRAYNDAVAKARAFDSTVRAEADLYDQQVRKKATEDANAMIADAQTRAEQIIFGAQQQAQKMTEENEIANRAKAYAMEVRESAQQQADDVYNQACMHADKLLSGAIVALSRSAKELAAQRDSILGTSHPHQGNP